MKRAQLLQFLPLVLFALCELLIWPAGNFPVNDDWSFSVSVERLLALGRLEITSWTLTGALPQIFAGALACLGGFNFQLLRLVGVASACAALLACQRLARIAGVSPAAVLVALAVAASNPLFLNLANSFMTDIPSATLLLAALIFFSHYLKTSSLRALCAGTIPSLLAILNRQVLVVAPLAFFSVGLGQLLRLPHAENAGTTVGAGRRQPTAVQIAFLAAPLLAGIAAITAHFLWLRSTHGVPFCMTVENQYLADLLADPLSQAKFFVGAALRLTLYLGGLLLPLTLLAAPSLIGSFKRLKVVAIELVLLIPALLIATGARMPLADNILYNFGVGPLLLDGGPGAVPSWTRMPEAAVLVWTALFGIGGALLLSFLAADIWLILRENGQQETAPSAVTGKLLYSVALFYSLAICTRGFFDRYLILLVLLLSVLIARRLTFSRPAGGGGLCLPLLSALCFALYCFVSVAGTRDYFEFQRAKWSLLHSAVDEMRIPANKIAGGWEFDHWFAYQPPAARVDITKNDVALESRIYLVSLAPPEKAEVVASCRFKSLLWGGERRLFLMRVPAGTLADQVAPEAVDTDP